MAIRIATSVALDNAYLMKSLLAMDIVFKKAGFNDAAKLGVLSQAMMTLTGLAQLEMYIGAGTY